MTHLFGGLRRAGHASQNSALPSPDPAEAIPLVGLRTARSVPVRLKPDSHVLNGSERQNEAREHFKYIEQKLHRLRKVSPLKRILVTSSSPREGKTVVATNLATTLANGAARVLLVDGDMRAPASANLFGLGGSPGLADVLEGRADPADVLIRLEGLNIYYVPAGSPTGNPGDLLHGDRLTGFLKTFEDFEWIVVDSPPIAVFADTLNLATHVESVILVARAGVTDPAELERAAGALHDNRSTIAAVVLNAFDQPRKRSGYYGYYSPPEPRS